MSSMPFVDFHVMVLMFNFECIVSAMLQEHVDGEFISTDIRYRGDKIMAGSGDKKDIKGGAAVASGGGTDVVSEGGEKDAKNTALEM